MKEKGKNARKGLQIAAKPAADQIKEINEQIWEMDEKEFDKIQKAISQVDVEAIVGKDEDHPVLINADGTTFHKTVLLKPCTTEYLDAYLAEKGRRAVITQIDDSPVIGSAIGALTL